MRSDGRRLATDVDGATMTIRVLPTCSFRRLYSRKSVCTHEANAGLSVTLRECEACPLVGASHNDQLTGQVGGSDAMRPADWPLAARIVRVLRKPTDTGVGDTIEREIGRVGGAFKWAMAQLEINCHCADRRATWNQRFPYQRDVRVSWDSTANRPDHRAAERTG